MNLFLFLAAAIGLTLIVTGSTIMEPVRTWVHNHLPAKVAEGIECHQCVGFWSGIVAGAILDTTVSMSSYWAILIFMVPLTLIALCSIYAPRCSTLCNFVVISIAVSASGIFTRPFWAIDHLIHAALLGCAGSMASVFAANILAWLDAHSMVDLGGGK